MDNQHRKIKNYRELSAEEIDLMNRIKEAGEVLMGLHAEVRDRIIAASSPEDDAEMRRQVDAEAMRWVAIGKTDVQTGVMALVRAVAQPAGV